jgi:hypothetical protein
VIWFWLGLSWVAIYLVACWLWPYTSCRACKGNSGKRFSPSGKAWGDCRRCKGKGRRVRIGRKTWNYLTNR